MIEIIDNFLNSYECNLLIEFYKKHKNFKYNKTFPVSITEKGCKNSKYIKKFSEPYYSTIKNIEEKVFYSLKSRTNIEYELYNAEIVRWPMFSDMDSHYDILGTEFSCIIYLNDTYIGGNTIVEGKVIKKKKGSMLIMKNSDKLLHKVTKNIFGARYTFPLWYGNEIFFSSS
jgi:hypothetical protein